MSIETASTSKATLSLIEEHIIEIDFFDNVEIDTDDLYEINSIRKKMIDNSPYAVLVLPGRFSNTTPEAKKLAAKKEIEGDRVAIAVVANSLPKKLMGNFYLRFNKPVFPTKLFETREEALEWLKQSMSAVAN